ncbi:galactosylgalactosylxylosylprotein 3-beta-glucuronosyltransferase I [Anastrepha ludens]|uniref:galactosylgalactosylxylosylprotein 3-beta-glucuronosyltransferase I n=1 Tax=Anastrepha ludens TaxID=28586 RepID=UPI0023B046A6|nr:galactosylgalactosylxylosylprotein 3-beta-glucuronosyltransferase I [Anastrepha ludens]XP_053951241.1 galactosylgalactosylxylosylprotein 3-beta-glucuronosyltransferase I [Anastrepha ludens]XP_053951242.1 galactosylgalactosylxylosylprotein 3-beta-glucuronosyltransferase I [Anastrepha ludens]XP_053951243.1 galactosylgalactosylxylosylprotein 3-beta-glucuronosyltransferase I [Anastrepha ludens]XP_053951244.1 galactosylgalactosylxylosylprotein 3-beta-glucuronosyltransferase I [Anastrepha ludens]
MSEMRIRPRQVLILVIVFLVVLLMVHRNGKRTCQGPEFMQIMYAKQAEASLPKIYAITPTYTRPSQKAELTRLSHIFMLVPNLHWIIIEDANTTTDVVRNLLTRASLLERSTHLNIKTPENFKLKGKDPNWMKPRGVEQRNLALSWIRANVDPQQHSAVFFMDDDNSYSVELFVEMTKIEPGRIGVWPVGLVGGLLVEKPLLNADNSQVIGFNAAWRPERPFPIDMAAFAISIDLLFKYPQAQFAYEVERGYQESEILRHLTTKQQLQPLANNCRDVLVWHTRTEKTNLGAEIKLNKEGKRSNEGMEV